MQDSEALISQVIFISRKPLGSRWASTYSLKGEIVDMHTPELVLNFVTQKNCSMGGKKGMYWQCYEVSCKPTVGNKGISRDVISSFSFCIVSGYWGEVHFWFCCLPIFKFSSMFCEQIFLFPFSETDRLLKHIVVYLKLTCAFPFL